MESSKKSGVSVDAATGTLTFILGAVIIVLKSIQIHCLRKRMDTRRNEQLVIVLSLAVADLLQGISAICIALTRSLSGLNEFLIDVYAVHLFTVSMLTLLLLSFVKLMAVTRNTHYRRSNLKRCLIAIWIIDGIVRTTEYIVFKLEAYSIDQEAYRKAASPFIVFLTTLTFIIFFGRIYFVVRRSNQDIGRQTNDNTMKIAIAQVMTFVICTWPSQTYKLVAMFTGIDDEEKHVKMQKGMLIFILLNPIVDPITFFIVNRHVWREAGNAGVEAAQNNNGNNINNEQGQLQLQLEGQGQPQAQEQQQ